MPRSAGLLASILLLCASGAAHIQPAIAEIEEPRCASVNDDGAYKLCIANGGSGANSDIRINATRDNVAVFDIPDGVAYVIYTPGDPNGFDEYRKQLRSLNGQSDTWRDLPVLHEYETESFSFYSLSSNQSGPYQHCMTFLELGVYDVLVLSIFDYHPDNRPPLDADVKFKNELDIHKQLVDALRHPDANEK
ncbi:MULTISPECIES: hypothetical protein [unclassified Roseovarius]|uniref:hypothetical protein n=1 Tax=unclassified Roseovarius TaxID=2614913 RepID=UPI00273DAD0A|nr:MULTISPECIES: hypothetical protein [unclassified Roseovarius]